MTKTFDLLNARPSGLPQVAGLFAKAHSHNWDVDRDVDWKVKMPAAHPLLGSGWGPYSRTPTFKALPLEARRIFTRRSFSFMLNSLRLGEAVAGQVCFQLGLVARQPDIKAHAAAQAMDEARHHFAYSRILELMGETPEEVDPATRATFDAVLAMKDPTDLVAWEQFYLESLAMNVLRHVVAHAKHPTIAKVFKLSLRDESRHMGFGVLYVEDLLASSSVEDQIAFAGRWLAQILTLSFGQQDPTHLRRTTRWLYDAGVANSLEVATALQREQVAVQQEQYVLAMNGTQVPQELRSARRAGLLAPHLLEALHLQHHPLILGALKGAAT